MNYLEIGKQIGKRIQEQRKYIKRVSQEKMADDLFMYQADISNLEKGKKGSGIMDLEKLIRLSEYLSVSLEFLIFGSKNNMIQYYKKKTAIDEGKTNSKQIKVLASLTGRKDTDINPITYKSGPFTICILKSIVKSAVFPMKLFEKKDVTIVDLSVDRYQFFTFYDSDVVSTMTVDKTTLLDNLVPDHIYALGQIIYKKNLDVTDVLRHLNPFVPLIQFGEEDKQKEYVNKSNDRNMELIALGEDNPVLYLESAYVKEEYRKNGIFTLNIDILKMMFENAVIWLNMEPLDETEMNSGNNPKHLTKDITQITLNNLIAEKLGFTIDPDLWGIEVKDDATQEVKKVRVRKCAYIIPEIYQQIIKEDNDLVEQGRIRQQLKLENKEMKKTNEPKLTMTYDADMNLNDFDFIQEDTTLDFSNMLIEKSEYSFYSYSPIPTNPAVITELVLQDQTNSKKYYFTLVDEDCNINLFITDKPFKGTYCAISDSGNEDLYDDLISDRAALFDPDSPDNLLETENEGLLPTVKTIVYLNKLNVEDFEKAVKDIHGMKVCDFLAKYKIQK